MYAIQTASPGAPGQRGPSGRPGQSGTPLPPTFGSIPHGSAPKLNPVAQPRAQPNQAAYGGYQHQLGQMQVQRPPQQCSISQRQQIQNQQIMVSRIAGQAQQPETSIALCSSEAGMLQSLRQQQLSLQHQPETNIAALLESLKGDVDEEAVIAAVTKTLEPEDVLDRCLDEETLVDMLYNRSKDVEPLNGALQQYDGSTAMDGLQPLVIPSLSGIDNYAYGGIVDGLYHQSAHVQPANDIIQQQLQLTTADKSGSSEVVEELYEQFATVDEKELEEQTEAAMQAAAANQDKLEKIIEVADQYRERTARLEALIAKNKEFNNRAMGARVPQQFALRQ